MENEVNLNRGEAFKKRMWEARQKALGGRTTHEAGEARVRDILFWTYKFEKSTLQILERVGGASRYGIVKKLIDKKLLKKTPTATGGFEYGVPKFVITLTLAGLDYVERYSEEFYNYRWAKDASGMPHNKLHHDFLAQIFTLQNLESGRAIDFIPEQRIGEMNTPGKKKPDVILITPEQKRLAVEVELSKKVGRNLDEFAIRVMRSLVVESNSERIDKFIVITDKPAIRTTYERALSPGATLNYWRKNDAGKWVPTQAKGKDLPIVPSWVNHTKFVTVLMEDPFKTLRETKPGKD